MIVNSHAIFKKYRGILCALHPISLNAAAAKSLQSCLTLQPHRRQPVLTSHKTIAQYQNQKRGYVCICMADSLC